MTAISHQDSLTFIWATVADFNRESLVDNGAAVCTVDISTLPRRYIGRIQPSRVQLKAANGTKLHTCGYLDIYINDYYFSHPFFVVKELQFPLILGLDFYRRYGLDILHSVDKLQGHIDGQAVYLADLHYEFTGAVVPQSAQPRPLAAPSCSARPAKAKLQRKQPQNNAPAGRTLRARATQCHQSEQKTTLTRPHLHPATGHRC